MIKYKTVMEPSRNVESVTCDMCKTAFSDIMDLQEFHHIYFTGGFNSAFGDMSSVECDVCSGCLKTLIGDFCRYGD